MSYLIITMLVDRIIMIIIPRASAVSNTGSRWAMAMMRLSVKTLNLSQCPPLPVAPHLFYSLLIPEMVVDKGLT